MSHHTIWHIDLDSFFVSAERLRNARLKDRPVAVGGEGPRGVIASCSYEARKFGVRSAMPTAKALKQCPMLILVPSDHHYYAELSRKVFTLIESFTPVFEATSIDEGYLDMTGMEQLLGPPLVAAAKLRRRITVETGLTASIGIAANRLLAKVASDFCKPNNVCLVSHGEEAVFLAPLPIERLPGCGRVTQEWLHTREVKTVGDLQRYPIDVLEKHLGSFGRHLHDSAWGRGSTEFHTEAKVRSISREVTFDENVTCAEKLESVLRQQCQELGHELRGTGVFARGVRLKLRYPPFQTVTRSRTLGKPTQGDKPLFEAVCALFREYREPGLPVRLIGSGCVLGESADQLDLFDDPSRCRDEAIDRLKDEICAKFGPSALVTGHHFDE